MARWYNYLACFKLSTHTQTRTPMMRTDETMRYMTLKAGMLAASISHKSCRRVGVACVLPCAIKTCTGRRNCNFPRGSRGDRWHRVGQCSHYCEHGASLGEKIDYLCGRVQGGRNEYPCSYFRLDFGVKFLRVTRLGRFVGDSKEERTAFYSATAESFAHRRLSREEIVCTAMQAVQHDQFRDYMVAHAPLTRVRTEVRKRHCLWQSNDQTIARS